MSRSNKIISRVVNIAKSMVGTRWRQGQTAQCANFVRYCFAKAKVDIGVSKNPEDFAKIPNEPQGASYANSFAGDDVGRKVGLDSLRAGDVVLFANTYGNYPPGVITHVGIMIDNATMVHRPTADRPVERASATSPIFACFHSARRPNAYCDVDDVAKLYMHDGLGAAIFDGAKSDGILKIFCHGGKCAAIACKIGYDYREYSEAYITISFAKNASYNISINNGKYTITRADGGVSDNAPAELVITSIDGKAEGHYSFGGEATDLGKNAKIEIIMRKQLS